VPVRIEPIVRVVGPVLVGVVLGLGVGGVWTLAQPDRYRAEARVLVRGTDEPGNAAAVRALAESSLLEGNVAQTLHLSHAPHVSARGGTGGVFTLSVEAGLPERARQIDAEAAQVLTRLVAARFGAAHLQATLLDPAHPVGRTSPTPGRNLILGGVLGLVAGVGATFALARRRPLPAVGGAVDPVVERRLKQRIDAVTMRERALAKRAGELAARERALEERARVLETREATPPPQPEPAPAPVVVAEPVLVPVPEPEPEPEPEHVPVPVQAESTPSRPGQVRLGELERRVRERGANFPDRLEDWNTYLYFLRDHAAIDGSLPPTFDGLIAEVFAEVLD
jgi:hypothetical protein